MILKNLASYNMQVKELVSNITYIVNLNMFSTILKNNNDII
jgi:hypothetical protein